MGFHVWKDMIGGGRPSPIEMYYNASLDSDGAVLRYKGSIAKIMDFDNVDHGCFVTFGLLTTAMENFVGILEEEVGTSGNYLPDATTYGMVRKKITPCFPSTVILGEYPLKDAAGTANTDTGATCTAASATFTIDTDTADELIGNWVYMVTGAEAGRLHYIKDSAANTSATFATAANKAIVSADTFLVINKANAREVLINATGTGFLSEVAYDLHVHRIVGIMTYVSDIGVPFQPLDRNLHDNGVFKNPKFYHAFTVGALNAWSNGIAAA